MKTLAFWEVKKGSEIPEHFHIHEQTTQVTEGEFEMTVDGDTFTAFSWEKTDKADALKAAI